MRDYKVHSYLINHAVITVEYIEARGDAGAFLGWISAIWGPRYPAVLFGCLGVPLGMQAGS